MTLEEAILKVLETHGMHQFDALSRDLAKCTELYGIAMHDRGNSHRKPWGYVPEDRQEKARRAAIVAFQGEKQ